MFNDGFQMSISPTALGLCLFQAGECVDVCLHTLFSYIVLENQAK